VGTRFKPRSAWRPRDAERPRSAFPRRAWERGSGCSSYTPKEEITHDPRTRRLPIGHFTPRLPATFLAALGLARRRRLWRLAHAGARLELVLRLRPAGRAPDYHLQARQGAAPRRGAGQGGLQGHPRGGEGRGLALRLADHLRDREAEEHRGAARPG